MDEMRPQPQVGQDLLDLRRRVVGQVDQAIPVAHHSRAEASRARLLPSACQRVNVEYAQRYSPLLINPVSTDTRYQADAAPVSALHTRDQRIPVLGLHQPF